jgi:acetaldehyde dehydrogenase (acetylating)
VSGGPDARPTAPGSPPPARPRRAEPGADRRHRGCDGRRDHPEAEALARLAVEETGYGVVADKVQKNLFASEKVYQFIRPLKTVGVIRRLEDKKIIEIAEPFGVVAAIVPSTNPTSTAIYKILIALKARCPIVISPHPAAVRCITRSRRNHARGGPARRRAGGQHRLDADRHARGTQELMKARDVAVILATGGMGLVRAAYSAGKPAYGVGPGNAPGLHRTLGRHPQSRRATSSPARPSTTACSARRRTRSSWMPRSPKR